MSTLCFDSQNLEAAVQAVVASVLAKNEAGILVMGTGQRIPITDAATIRQHLMDKAYQRFQECVAKGFIDIARIEGVIYSPVGFVFEQAPDIITPAPPTPNGQSATQSYTHQAYFWSIL